ncbi:MAG TPA: alpha/beta hydrolase [Dehalococcoidia bacterium]|nr:alpha/beta hydrolase [Dehalococcoidia bacterium]
MSGFGTRSAMTIVRVPLQDSPRSFGLDYEDVSFPSRVDRVMLKGWLMPAQKDWVVVVVNGGYQNRIDDDGATLGMTADLVAEGYNVLLFDLRGRGESEGTGYTLSNAEEDIGGAVDYLTSLGYGLEDICIMGLCSGAALSTFYVSANDVGALILDGCFDRVYNMVLREAEGVGVPSYFTAVFLPGLYVMSNVIYGYELINPIDVVDDIKCPILFIHEEFDAFVTMEETYELYQASGNPRDEIWQVMGAEHSHGYIVGQEEYIEKITEFLDMAM